MGAPGAPGGPALSAASGTQLEDGTQIKPAIKSVIPTPMRIGFLGLGIMGQGMVMNLLRSGHEVTVWNRTTLKVSGSFSYVDLLWVNVFRIIVPECRSLRLNSHEKSRSTELQRLL